METRVRIGLLMLPFFLGGCIYDLPDENESGVFACDSSDDCLDGFTCVGGRCSDGTEPPPECDADHPCTESNHECVQNVCVPIQIQHERSAVFPTAAGGLTTNSAYNLRVTVGAPQPMGTVSNGSYRLKVWPMVGAQ